MQIIFNNKSYTPFAVAINENEVKLKAISEDGEIIDIEDIKKIFED